MTVNDILLTYREGKLTPQQAIERLRQLKTQAAVRHPLSEGQKGLWMLQSAQPEGSGYNVPICFRLRKPVDLDRFREACRRLVEQQPILGAVIEEENGVPYLKRTAQAPAVEVEDIAEGDVLACLQRRAKEPFALHGGPLMRIRLLNRAADEQYLLIVVHHVICDGRSVELLVDGLFGAYTRRPAREAAPLHFGDFVEWEQRFLAGPQAEAHRAYWGRQLSGALPTLKLPTDRARRGAGQTIDGHHHGTELPADLGARIKSFCAAQNVNAPALFLSAFKVLLHRYSGETDIIVGMPTLGRPEDRFERLVGNFVNTVPLRSAIDGAQSVASFLRAEQLTLIDALDHAAYPFPQVVRDLKLSGTDVFQVVFEYKSQNVLSYATLDPYRDALGVEAVEGIRQEGEYELILEVIERGDRFALNVMYDRNLFEAATIGRLIGHLRRLLEGIVAVPESRIADLPLLGDDERRALLAEGNDPAVAFPQDRCLHELFAEQVQRTPDALAVIYDGELLTYAELDRRANQLAHHLRALGVGPETIVGLCVERSLDIVLGIVAILKAGGAYLPLDPAYPSDRLAYMLSAASVPVVITQELLLGQLPESAARVVCLERDEAAIDAQPETAPESGAGPQSLAYVIYTSGSTGKPNGVMITHANVVRLMASTEKLFGFGADDVWTLFHSYAFDFSVWEIWGALLYGGRVVVVPHLVSRTPELFYELLYRERVTVLNQTPSAFNQLVRVDGEVRKPLDLRYVIFGGEGLKVESLRPWLERHGDRRPELINMYGITETTVHVTYRPIRMEDLDGPIASPVGGPLPDLQCYVLDERMEPMPIGVPGELYVGGAGLARGYLNNVELTLKRFLASPFSNSSTGGGRLYRTGDLVRYLGNNAYEFLGRVDFQVKIRGHRIELGEIEAALLRHESVKEAVVLAREEESGQKRLVAYHVGGDARELREHLRKSLPDYMVPAAFVPLDAMPLNHNGKADRKVLAAMPIGAKRETAPAVQPAPARLEIQQRVLAAWQRVLNLTEIDAEDGFFDVGGDSILAVTLARRISEEFAVPFNVTSLFKYTTVAAISRYIVEQVAGSRPVATSETPTPSTVNRQLPTYYRESVAIIGISCQFPGAANHREFWRNLTAGKESIEILSAEELRALGVPQSLLSNPRYVAARSTIAGKELFDAKFWDISPREAEVMDPQLRHLLLHSWRAVEDAGYVCRDIADASVFMSASNSFYRALTPSVEAMTEGSDQYVSWVLSQGGTIPTVISHRLGLEGRSLFLHSNCSSSLVGLDAAYRCLVSGESKYALVGAATLFPFASPGYVHQNGMNFSSDGHLRAFDADADGMIGGEGVGVVLLKRAADAVADGDHIYAIVRGVAVNNDGGEKSGYYAPSVQGQARVIQKALEASKVDPETIGYIEAHGTGTRLGDPIEFAALNEVYRKHTAKKQYCGIGSVKTNVGHLDTAAGLAGCIKAALSLGEGVIPPTLHYSRPNAEIDFGSSPFFVADTLTRWDERQTPRRAGVSSFGIGGTNAHAVLEQAPDAVDVAEVEGFRLVPLAARNEERLRFSARQLAAFLADDDLRLADVAYTLQVGREAMASRAVFLVESTQELIAKLEAFAAGNDEGCFVGAGKAESLIESEESTDLVRSWIESGKHAKAAKLWVSGVDVDWKELYRKGECRRVSLPTYPFAEEAHWAPVVNVAVVEKAASPAQAAPTSSVTSTLVQEAAALLKHGVDDIAADGEWSSFGFDSISLAAFAERLTQLFGTEIAPTIFFEHPTPRRLGAYLAGENVGRALQPARVGAGAEPIAIIGIAGRFPQAPDLDAFWDNLRLGKDCVTEIPKDRWDWEAVYGDPQERNKTNNKWGAFLDGIAEFDPLFFGISPREAELMDPQQRLLMTYVWKCIEDAGYAPQSLSGSRTAIFAGTSGSGYEGLFLDADLPIESYSFSGLIPSIGPARMSYLLDLHGPSEPIETACSSSLVAIHRGIQAIFNDQCEMAIVGGVNTVVSAPLHISVSKAGMLADDGRCKTFSAGANGFVRGEGVGMLLLKRLSAAERDGDHIHAVIRGTAENHGGRANSLTAPNPQAQAELLKAAYTAAGIDPRTVTYIEAHGTGTALGDPIEINALKSAFADLYAATGTRDIAGPHCGLASVKSNIGHLELAAGIAGVIKVLLQMRHQTFARSLHCEELNPLIELEGSPFYILQEPRPWVGLRDAEGRELPRRAGVSSFGIGGVNAHVVLEEYVSNAAAIAAPGPHCIVLSAKNEDRLKDQVAQLLRALDRFDDADLPAIAYTLQTGRDAMEHRLALTASSIAELRQKLEQGTDVYRGEVKRNKGALSVFAADEDLGRAIDAWVEKRKYSRLLELWVGGLAFDWTRLWGANSPRRVNLPTYPFARDRYWPTAAAQPVREEQPKAEPFELMTFEETWQESPLVASAPAPKRVLCFLPDPRRRAEAMEAVKGELIFAEPGDYKLDHGALDAILYLLPPAGDPAPIVNLIKAIAKSGIRCPRLLIAGEAVNGADRCHFESWMGFERSLGLVLPSTRVAVIFEEGTASTADWMRRLWQELRAAKAESALYRDGRRHVARVQAGRSEAGQSLLRNGGTYLITGGTGGLGAMFAEHLMKRYGAKVIVTGRSARSSSAVLEQADVCDAARMAEIVRRHAPIHGVIHAAGVAGELGIIENSLERFRQVLDPKVKGTLALDEALADQPLDFFCLFSSSSAVLGDFGGCDYAIANRFELAFADHRERLRARGLRQGRTVAICWPHWKNGGMAAGEEHSEAARLYLKSSGQRLLETEEGIAAFERLIATEGSRHIVMTGQRGRVERFLGLGEEKTAGEAAGGPAGGAAGAPRRRPEMRRFTLEQCIAWDLKEHASELVKISRDRLDDDENLADFGFDSIGLGEFAKRLSQHYGIDVTPSIFFSHPTLGRLTEHFAKEHRAALTEFYGEEKQQAHVAPVVRAKELPSPAPQPSGAIAIIGMSGRFPQARSIDEMWRILFEGRNAVTEVPADRFDARKTSWRWLGSLPGVAEFDPLFFEIAPTEAETMDPRQRLLLQEAWKALEDAGYGAAQLEREKIGMFVGVEQGDYQLLVGNRGGLISNHDAILAARLSYFLNLRGPSMAINTTCSSGLVAAHQACLSLRNGECDTAIAAAVNLMCTPFPLATMGQAGMLSPDGKCYAFDARANGMVPGEAVVVVVLKRLEQAIADGDPIHAVIRGSGVNYDGKTNGITAPSGASQTALLREVYERTQIDPRQLDYIVTHGTGTNLGDPVEINALCDAFKPYTSDAGFCALTSTKTNFGHTFAASGLVSLAGLVQAMRHETIPASLHCEKENGYIAWQSSPFYVNKENKEWRRNGKPRLGAVSAFGMSGTNAHMVVEAYDAPLALDAPPPPPLHLLALSAKTEAALAAKVRDLLGALSAGEWDAQSLHAMSYTLLCARQHFDHRVAVVVSDRDDAVRILGRFGGREKLPSLFSGRVPRGFTALPATMRYAEGLIEGGAGSGEDSLAALADLYCQGYELPWERFFGEHKPRRIALPTYPFAAETYWIAPQSPKPQPQSQPQTNTRALLEKVFQGAMTAEQARELLHEVHS